jgi:hypothetical protein
VSGSANQYGGGRPTGAGGDDGKDERGGVKVGYPLICDAHGGPSEDGCHLLVEALTIDGQPVRFAMPMGEAKHFVSFLLRALANIAAIQKAQGLSALPTGEPTRPIPLTAIGIGHPENGEGYLQMTIGCADLLFAVPISAFEPVARSMLLASIEPKDTPSV